MREADDQFDHAFADGILRLNSSGDFAIAIEILRAGLPFSHLMVEPGLSLGGKLRLFSAQTAPKGCRQNKEVKESSVHENRHQ